MATVLVVDDEPQVLHALRRVLEGQGERVVAASTGAEAVDLAAAQAPDLVVLDLWLPDVDGVEVVRRLRGWLDVPILILSGDTDEERKVAALDAGADDFLQKPFGFPELVARLRALRRRTVRDEAQSRLEFGELVVDLARGSVHLEDEQVRLTPTEWQLLEAMVTHPGKLLTHRWLLARVWGSGHGDESRQALRTHIRSLRAKLRDDAATPRYLRTESGAGYRWLGEPAAPAPEDDGRGGAERPRGRSTNPAATEAVHDLNNVLTALHLAVHLATERAGRLDGGTDGEQVLAQLRRSRHLLDRAGGLVADVRSALEDDPGLGPVGRAHGTDPRTDPGHAGHTGRTTVGDRRS